METNTQTQEQTGATLFESEPVTSEREPITRLRWTADERRRLSYEAAWQLFDRPKLTMNDAILRAQSALEPDRRRERLSEVTKPMMDIIVAEVETNLQMLKITQGETLPGENNHDEVVPKATIREQARLIPIGILLGDIIERIMTPIVESAIIDLTRKMDDAFAESFEKSKTSSVDQKHYIAPAVEDRPELSNG